MKESQSQKIKQILEKVKPEGKILDVGSGPGFLEEFVDAVATDVDLENLKKARGKKVLCTGDALPFKDKSFDWLFCLDTVHKLKNTSDLKRVGKNLVVSLFCNENNAEEKMEELKAMFPCHKQSFFVKTEREWDAVVIL